MARKLFSKAGVFHEYTAPKRAAKPRKLCTAAAMFERSYRRACASAANAVNYCYTRKREYNNRRSHHDQLPRDPAAAQPGTEQNGDSRKHGLLQKHRHKRHPTRRSLWSVVPASRRTIGQAACRNAVSGSSKAGIQDARLCIRPQGTAEGRRHAEPAVAGILRSLPQCRRASVSVHTIQQVLQRLRCQNQRHHAPAS